MVERRKPIHIEEAVQRVMQHARDGQSETVQIDDAYGRRLAANITATHPVPPFDRSPYDGFAIRSEDSKDASLDNSVSFKVVDEIGAGYVTDKTVGAFEAVRIMTGAQLPEECDAVVMLELANEFQREDGAYMSIKRSYKSGDNVSFKGEDTQEGSVIARKGEMINPGVVANLATFGYHEVSAAKKPVIGVYATGSELLEVSDPLEPGKIRNSNGHMVCAQIQRAGGEARYFGKLPDDFDTCYESIKTASQSVDMLITTGGVSVGDFDYLPAIYEKMGAEVLFNKVAMRPGSVTTVAAWEGKFLFGLSGNPSACYVGFELFTRPVINKALFSQKPHLRKMQAVLAEDFTKANPFTRFVRGSLGFSGVTMTAVPSGFNKSNAVTSLAATDVLIVLPGGTRGFTKGDTVDVLLLEDQIGSEWPWS
ncbi:gephyrin-like molybdotransferase Glp [Fictibacillus aquaticus]|uniref:Molybdopterin molybdenumtransferase n=1 Tax=Fictibacillus aquaticus TaxID=2021314 RepID=A0A235F4L0_9BACL|nr:gephyrin-like molybdotransferase Glp [Fictibacillus aquaticus]OYD56190.1 molybdopterin molybdenumtransferase [Fictibacillus aquaticus]